MMMIIVGFDFLEGGVRKTLDGREGEGKKKREGGGKRRKKGGERRKKPPSSFGEGLHRQRHQNPTPLPLEDHPQASTLSLPPYLPVGGGVRRGRKKKKRKKEKEKKKRKKERKKKKRKEKKKIKRHHLLQEEWHPPKRGGFSQDPIRQHNQ